MNMFQTRFCLRWRDCNIVEPLMKGHPNKRPHPSFKTTFSVTFFCKFPCHHHDHHLSLDHERRWGTKNDFVTSFLHFSLFSTWWTPGPSIPWCCLPTSSSVCLAFFPLSPCLARWFWPALMNGRHDHTTTVCISLRWSGGLRVVQLPAGQLVPQLIVKPWTSCWCPRIDRFIM